ncbi:MAG TPA: hypothetical protein VN408_25920 [Actinoplanes sp.]|nr:hypothetical protein [Actinoplanes sp.]
MIELHKEPYRRRTSRTGADAVGLITPTRPCRIGCHGRIHPPELTGPEGEVIRPFAEGEAVGDAYMRLLVAVLAVVVLAVADVGPDPGLTRRTCAIPG